MLKRNTSYTECIVFVLSMSRISLKCLCPLLVIHVGGASGSQSARQAVLQPSLVLTNMSDLMVVLFLSRFRLFRDLFSFTRS